MNMATVVAERAPDLRYLLGVVPDAELADRVIDVAVASAVEEALAPMSTETEVEDRCAEAVTALKDDLYHILKDVEWDTAEDLAKLIREVLDA